MNARKNILILLLLASTCCFGQEKTASVKQRISGHLSRIAAFQKNKQNDSLLVENKVLMTYLEKAFAKDAALMNADLELNTLSSDDGKLKIYQWKTGLIDTLQGKAGEAAIYIDNYRAIAAFKTDNGLGTTVVQEKMEQEMRYDSLFSVKGEDRTYYLLVSNGMDKMANKVMKMQACYIDGSLLSNNANIFSTSGSSVSNISIAYSRNSPTPGTMQLSGDKQPLSIHSPGNIKKALVYKFDGHTFVQQKAP